MNANDREKRIAEIKARTEVGLPWGTDIRTTKFLLAEIERLRDKADQWDAAQPMIAAMTLVVEAARANVARVELIAALHDEGTANEDS